MDPHVHADAFYDCEMPVEAVLARTAAVDPDTVTITDHNSIGAFPRAFDITHECGVRVAPDAEVLTADGHLLVFGVDDPPAARQLLSETAREVHEAGGLAVVLHSFQTFRHDVSRRAIRDVDTIEAYSAHTLTGFRSGQARRYARRQELPGMGGNDAHRSALVGQAYVVVPVEADGGVTTDATLEGIRVGRTVTRGTRTTACRYLREYALNTRLETASFL